MIRNLQALRGVACLVVVWHHVAGIEYQSFGLRTPLFHAGWWFGAAGVDLFFVLSGFVITYVHWNQLGRPPAVPAYLFRRAWRIYPIYWVVLLLSTFGVSAAIGLEPGGGDWWNWLKLVALLPRADNLWLGQAWTLTFEMMFYVAFAALLLVPARWGWVLLAGWAAAVVTAVAAGYAVQNGDGADPLSPFVLEFLAGCFIAARVRRGACGWGRSALVAGLVYGVAAALLLSPPSHAGWVRTTTAQWSRVLIYGPAAALLVYGSVAAELAGRRPFPRWLRVTGDASYSIYLAHVPACILALAYGASLPHDRWPHVGWIVVTLAAGVGCGFLLHYAVERPLLAAGRRTKARPQAVPMTAAEPPARLAA